MNLLFTSILIIILATGGILIILNYLIISWESQKVDALASKIKHSDHGDNSILYKSEVSREFTSLDLIKVSKASLHRASNIYDKTLVKITSQEYPSWVFRFVEEISKLRKNFGQTISGWFKYVVSLSKPVIEESKNDKVNAFREQKKIEEIEDFVDKVVDNNISAANSLLILEENNADSQDNQDKNETSLENKTATLNLASSSSKSTGTSSEQGIFEKLENRILQKMKDVGLGNYDLWLELGQLYLKYGEKDKAVEVFALVLKHTQDEGQKDLARNQLIGLN